MRRRPAVLYRPDSKKSDTVIPDAGVTEPSGQTGSTTPGTGQTTPAVTPAAPDSQTDRAVLVALYQATSGSGWSASARVNWLSDKPMAEWAGVTTEEGYVTELDLGSSGLSGEIPARMGELTGLKSANLRGNELSGCIPANTRLRKALFQSYNLGRGPGKEPG